MMWVIPFAFGIVAGLFLAAAYVVATAERRRVARDDDCGAPEGGERR